MTQARSASSAQAHAVQDDPRWTQLVARDRGADGQFVYSVATTGVYCRPSCPSRRPRPENVAFHDTPAAAEACGFRACKRCRPRSAARSDPGTEQVAALCRLIDTQAEPVTLSMLAAHIGRSRFYTQRLFKAVTGISPKAYAAAQRAQRLRSDLHAQSPVTDALYAAGFGSSSRLYEQSSALLGMTPRQYRSGGAQLVIQFAVCPCSLGHVLAAATRRGVCAIWLGDDPAQLAADLQKRFPQAQLQIGDAAFGAVLADIVRFVDDPAKRARPSLPLDIQGTAFQQRVWQHLTQIPPGQTRSYQQIAAELGQPQSVRAVARACAQNSLAVVIPCHRVVRSDGRLAGYRWGLDRKQTLLARESGDLSHASGPYGRGMRRRGA